MKWLKGDAINVMNIYSGVNLHMNILHLHRIICGACDTWVTAHLENSSSKMAFHDEIEIIVWVVACGIFHASAYKWAFFVIYCLVTHFERATLNAQDTMRAVFTAWFTIWLKEREKCLRAKERYRAKWCLNTPRRFFFILRREQFAKG